VRSRPALAAQRGPSAAAPSATTASAACISAHHEGNRTTRVTPRPPPATRSFQAAAAPLGSLAVGCQGAAVRPTAVSSSRTGAEIRARARDIGAACLMLQRHAVAGVISLLVTAASCLRAAGPHARPRWRHGTGPVSNAIFWPVGDLRRPLGDRRGHVVAHALEEREL
jgi:hypothetical protein